MWEFGLFLLNSCGSLRAAVPALLAALAVGLALAQYRQGAIAALIFSLYLSVALQRWWRRHTTPLQQSLRLLASTLGGGAGSEELLVRCRDQQRLTEHLRSRTALSPTGC